MDDFECFSFFLCFRHFPAVFAFGCGVGVWEGAPSWLFVFCWGAAYINPLTVISIVEAVRARKGSVFIHTVSCSHWVSTHSNHMAELDWKLFFPTFLQLGPNNELIYQWLTLIVFVIYFPFCYINRGSWTVGSFHAPWQFQDNIGALGITDEDQWIVMNQLWDVRTWYCWWLKSGKLTSWGKGHLSHDFSIF